MRFHENLLILSATQIEDSDEVDETELSGKQGTTSLGRTEELPRPQRGSPGCILAAIFVMIKGGSFSDFCEQCLDNMIGVLLALLMLWFLSSGGLGSFIAWLVARGFSAEAIKAVLEGLAGVFGQGFSNNFLHDLCHPRFGGSNLCGDFDRESPGQTILKNWGGHNMAHNMEQ